MITKETTEVQIKQLKLEMSPRIGGQDHDHAQTLAFRFDECPPILVERDTSTVIDGVHRVLAAKILGRETVVARFFEGTHEEAFVESVKANVTHGKPLTLAEREAAAATLLGMHANWSNRLVADVCGLSDKTVGRLRKASAELPQLSARVGRDGRLRPTNSRHLRDQIASALQAKPDASAEEVAHSLSTSPSTVRDVRRRIRRGDDPNGSERAITIGRSGVVSERTSDRRTISAAAEWRDDRAILALPSGGELAEWLDRTRIRADNWTALIDVIPLGRIPELIQEAERRALEWTRFTTALEQRFRELNRRSPGSP